MIRVRVRGIYATAISKLLIDNGFFLADVSDVIKSRITYPMVEGPADITVKSVDDDPDTILVIGSPWEYGLEVEKVIVENLNYASIRRGGFGLYTTLIATSLGDCRAQLPGGVEALVQGECPQRGVDFHAYIVKESLHRDDKPIVRPGVALVGLYVTLYAPGEGFSFSEHIRDESKRINLVDAVKSRVASTNAHVRFRSNSKFATLAEVASEVETLLDKINKLLSEKPQDKPRILSKGEYISLIYIPSPSKILLDNYRDAIQPTIKYHHSLKAGGFEESILVDFSEEAVRLGKASKDIGYAILSYIASSTKGRRVSIDHRLPDGRRIQLGPFEVENYTLNDTLKITLTRTFKTKGILDGLNIEKRPGDYSRTIIDTGSWHIIHEYYSREGKLLGVYVNINTPPEVSFKGIRYLDLYIDIVKRVSSEPELVDLRELEEAYNVGLISSGLYEKALDEAKKIIKKISGEYP
ncbi:MAG: DUF402 domain-containing protein [Acidilobaceae archaeon]